MSLGWLPVQPLTMDKELVTNELERLRERNKSLKIRPEEGGREDVVDGAGGTAVDPAAGLSVGGGGRSPVGTGSSSHVTGSSTSRSGVTTERTEESGAGTDRG